MIYKDQLNREVQLHQPPKRIVSLVPSQTELLVDLGLSDYIVGLTKFCVHPKQLIKQKTLVGGTKNINYSKVKALNPDIILCNKEENSLDIIEALEGVAPIHISDIYSVKDCYELIHMYGSIFNVELKADQLVNSIEDERKAFRLNNLQPQKKAAYFIWKNPWMVAASNTFINAMLKEAGYINVFEKEERYPEITLKHSKLLEADVIMLSSEPFPFKNKHIKELKLHFPNKETIIVDGELFSWYGSRLIKAFKIIRK